MTSNSPGASAVFLREGRPAHAVFARSGQTSFVACGAALVLLSLAACSPDLGPARTAGQAQAGGTGIELPPDVPGPRPLTERVTLLRTQAHHATRSALVRIDGAPTRTLLVGQIVAERGVVEQITSRSIAIREGALVYVILTSPTVAPDPTALTALTALTAPDRGGERR